MIFVTGDTHGEIDFAKLYFLKDLNLSYDDYLIICGDAGICWDPNLLDESLKLYNSLGCTILFVDGNHENFQMLNSMPIVKNKGAIMHQIDGHIFHILRGEIMTLEGKTFLCIGGANSIDKNDREPYISWWPEEEITYEDIEKAFANLEKINNRVDYVITHCCDLPTVIKSFHFEGDASSYQLTLIDRFVQYEHWFFGHYHRDCEINDKKTCLYQCVVEM